ncbi:hypothetical protein MCETHM1_00163 [Flavobacteriaceae bacterium]
MNVLINKKRNNLFQVCKYSIQALIYLILVEYLKTNSTIIIPKSKAQSRSRTFKE